jgi:uncharacterized protein YjbJ (UPF0337 family)
MILEYPDSGALTTRGRRSAPESLIRTEAMEMKPSSENQVTGKIHEVKGAIKEKAGRLTGNPDLEAEGTGEKIAGKVLKKIGQVQKVVEKA